MQSAYQSLLEKETTRFDLGLENLSHNGNASQEYWSRMHAAIVEVGQSAYRPLNTLLLIGEDADSPDFARTVKDAVRELIQDPSTQYTPRLLVEVEPLWLAARGAAEFVKRTQEAPAGCREPKRCAKSRNSSIGMLSSQAPMRNMLPGADLEM